MSVRVTKSSGNVFLDLGHTPEEAENLRIRSELMMRLSDLIESRRWSQREAARRLGVSQPRVSDLVRGKIGRFSIDSLVTMLTRAGLTVSFSATRRRKVA